MAAMIGLLVMGIVNIGTEASGDFKTFIQDVGKAWIPNAQGIGPYSGKETFMLMGWLASWALLHFLIRRKEVSLKTPVIIFLAGLGLATLLVYTPFIHFIL